MAQDFEKLWKAYGHRQRKADARTSFEKLAPTPERVIQMIEAATAWRLAWEEQNKPDAPRFSLKKWIEREEYECEPPTAYKAKEHKPTSPTKTSPPGSLPRKFKIEAAGVDTYDGMSVDLSLEFSPVDGGNWESVFLNLELGDLTTEVLDGAPNSEFAGFWRALRFMGHPEQPSDLVGCLFWATGMGDDFEYHTEAEALALINGEPDAAPTVEVDPLPDWLLTTPEPLPDLKGPRWVPDANAPWRRVKAA
ncbi:hypothetical protein [Devosia aquimaris]|uniref:hypothetical protein n=1 Tax=Devosia aquimaris TaxID=2866214 RepID=UPI001CD0BBE4|nr:hypothetical protein [Devosia sp. CJK-A8-3]